MIAIKTDDGKKAGRISFYCRALEVSRAAFYDYLDRKNRPWKYQPLADAMMKIHDEDKCNDRYGRNVPKQAHGSENIGKIPTCRWVIND